MCLNGIVWYCVVCGEALDAHEGYIPPVDAVTSEPKPICESCLDDDKQLSKVAGVPPWKGEH